MSISRTKSNSNSLIFPYPLSHHIGEFPFQLSTYRGEVLQQLDFSLSPFPLLSRGVNLSVTSSFPLPSPRVPFPVASRAAAGALLLPQQEARPRPPPQGPARHQAPGGPARQQARPPLPRRHPRARCTHLPLRTRARQGRVTAQEPKRGLHSRVPAVKGRPSCARTRQRASARSGGRPPPPDLILNVSAVPTAIREKVSFAIRRIVHSTQN